MHLHGLRQQKLRQNNNIFSILYDQPDGLVIFKYRILILIQITFLSKIEIMKKTNKKKSEITIENVFKEKFALIYTGFIIVVFSLFYQDAFFNIAQAKRGIYIWSTAVFAVLMLMLSMYSAIGCIKNHEKNKHDIIDFLMLMLIASWGIGMFFAINPKESFLGEYNKCTGLIMYVTGIVAMYYISKYLHWKVELVWSILFATTVVYILQILNRFNIDPLGMYNEIADDQRRAYLSTLGHGNYNAAYNCLTIVIIMVFFYLCREKISKIVYGILLFTGFAGSISCCADSVYLGIGVAFVVLLGYSFAHMDKWWNFYIELAIFWAAQLSIALINKIFPDKATGFWGISESMIDFKLIGAELIVLVLILGLVKFLYTKMSKNAQLVSKIYTVAVVAVVVLGILMMVIVNITGIDSGVLGGLYIDDDWGSSRGSIWKTIVSLLKASSIGHLLFGYGHNMVKDALIMVLGTDTNNVGEAIADAHNVFLNSLVTSGIVGTVIFTSIIVLILYRGFKLLKENERGLFVVIGLLAYVAQGMINGPQSITTPVFLIELGIFWNLVRTETIGDKNSEK